MELLSGGIPICVSVRDLQSLSDAISATTMTKAAEHVPSPPLSDHTQRQTLEAAEVRSRVEGRSLVEV